MNFIPLKLKRIIKEGARDLYYFGFEVMLAKIYWILADESEKSIIYRNQMLVQWLTKRYQWLIEKYCSEDRESIRLETDSSPLWVFWWQGEENMPDIIRLCHQSKLKAAKNHPVILLTKENIQQYVEFPDYVWEQFDRKKIRIQHLADMIRVQLIKNYGGIWLDASIYCMNEFSDGIFESYIFSLRGKQDKRYVSEGRWTTFAIGGKKDNILCSFLNEFFVEYCKTGKPFIDYFMFDCAIAVAYNNLPQVKDAIDKLSISKNCYWLDKSLREEVGIPENVEYQETIQKIAWKNWVDKTPVNGSLYLYLQKRISDYE